MALLQVHYLQHQHWHHFISPAPVLRLQTLLTFSYCPSCTFFAILAHTRYSVYFCRYFHFTFATPKFRKFACSQTMPKTCSTNILTDFSGDFFNFQNVVYLQFLYIYIVNHYYIFFNLLKKLQQSFDSQYEKC